MNHTSPGNHIQFPELSWPEHPQEIIHPENRTDVLLDSPVKTQPLETQKASEASTVESLYTDPDENERPGVLYYLLVVGVVLAFVYIVLSAAA